MASIIGLCPHKKNHQLSWWILIPRKPRKISKANLDPLVYFYHGDASRYWECNWILGKKLRRLDLKNASTKLTESTVEFKYNGFGLRHKKLAGNKVSEYFYSGSQLIRENRGNDVILYNYDASGITAIEYIINGVSYTYYYRKNLQGDIIALLDESGKCVVKYAYNAWGKCVVLTDTSGISLSIINPIRYRGYYYDEETGFYYLVSRYYDPEVGRFINADDINYLDPLSINGQNLYAYCLNNPVMLSDPTGCFPIAIVIILGVAAIIGGAVGGKFAYDNAVSAGKVDSDLFWSTVAGVFVGASAGLALGGLIIATGGAIVGAIGGLSASAFGVTALQAFVIGALAFNQFAFITAPILGITMDGIETIPDGDKTKVPKPGETPKHPASKNIVLQWFSPFNSYISKCNMFDLLHINRYYKDFYLDNKGV